MGIAILISNKIDSKTKVVRDKEGYNIIIKGSNQQENITSSNNEKMLALILVGFLYVYIVRAR